MVIVSRDRPEVIAPPTLGSEAVAERVIVPLTVPEEGEVKATVGAVTSGVRGGAWVVAETEVL